MRHNLLKIINHYGVKSQLKLFHSKISELCEAILDDELDFDHITEEITDCYVMLEQFRYYYGISNEELKKIMKYKINRQFERMKENE